MPWEIVILITHLSGVLCMCVCVYVVSHKTRADTLTHTHTHTHSPGTLRSGSSRGQANYTAWHFISHFAFISHKYHLHILDSKQQQQKSGDGAGDEEEAEEKCPRVGLKYLRGCFDAFTF